MFDAWYAHIGELAASNPFVLGKMMGGLLIITLFNLGFIIIEYFKNESLKKDVRRIESEYRTRMSKIERERY